jgi:hypothetical protein
VLLSPTIDRRYREETTRQEKGERQSKDQEVKKQLAKLSNSQKSKAVKKFAKKHPQFVKLSKIHYPIDDNLIYLDPLLHQVTLAEPKPQPTELCIPPHLLGELLFITDFIWTFKEVVAVNPFTVSQLYNELNTHQESPLLHELLMALVKVIVESCLSKETETQLVEDSHLALLRKLSDHFDILKIVPCCYLTLLGELLRSPMWKVYSEDSKELLHLAKHKLSAAPMEDYYYSHYSYEEKLALLVFATHCLCDTKALHEELASRLEERHRFARQRQEIKGDIRNIENKAKDKSGTTTRKSQMASDKISRLEEKLAKETEAMSEVTVRTASLGLDREYHEYFLFNFDRSKLYVRLPVPLDSVRKQRDETGYWYAYKTMDEVERVIGSLCVKGIREAKLYEGLTSALPKFKFTEETAEENRPYSNKFTGFDSVTCSTEGVRRAILNLERGLSTHLAKTSKRWELPIPHRDWIELISTEVDAAGLAQLVHDFGNKANTPYKVFPTQATSEEEEEDGLHYRRVNLRIWQDFGESFGLWCNLLENCRTLSSLQLCVMLYECVLQNYYRKRPDRLHESKKKPDSESPVTRRIRTEEQTEAEIRKKLKEVEWEHDEVCFFCSKYGELLCCETCSRVVHPSCIGLEKVPSEDWFCDDCLSKQETVPQTRSRTRLRKIA